MCILCQDRKYADHVTFKPRAQPGEEGRFQCLISRNRRLIGGNAARPDDPPSAKKLHMQVCVREAGVRRSSGSILLISVADRCGWLELFVPVVLGLIATRHVCWLPLLEEGYALGLLVGATRCSIVARSVDESRGVGYSHVCPGLLVVTDRCSMQGTGRLTGSMIDCQCQLLQRPKLTFVGDARCIGRMKRCGLRRGRDDRYRKELWFCWYRGRISVEQTVADGVSGRVLFPIEGGV